MGTIAARDLMQISDLAMDALAIHLMAIRQGFYLLEEKGQMPALADSLGAALDSLRDAFPMTLEDRALDTDIAAVRSVYFQGLS